MKIKSKKGFFGNLFYGTIIALGLFGGSKILVHEINNNKDYLKPENFNQAGWIEFYNANGTIWHCYMNEDIPKNQVNWDLYLNKVREKNNNNLAGRILLPDLDGNKKVGK